MQSGRGNELADVDSGVAPDRQRLFIARQACESCRQKKTRCDGDSPCGACRSTGVECVFSGRKATKNEVSLGMIFNTLERIERKIERQQTPSATVNAPSPSERPGRGGRSSSGDILTPRTDEAEPTVSRHQESLQGSNRGDGIAPGPVAVAPHVPVIPYPIRQIATWPAIRPFLASISKEGQNHATYSAYRATVLERKRPALPPTTVATPEELLPRLSLSLVKDLCDGYFATFNLANPILDRKLFGQHTMGMAVNSEFGSNVESCLVLVVMALGSLGKVALREAGFGTSFGIDADSTPPSGYDRESGDSLLFFNEARRRAGFVNCDNSLQSCQYYLLSGLFYSQLIRPIDWWTMVNRASVCCTSFWACPPEDCDEWMMDMQSRLFWNTAMFEDVLTQELDLPVSNLRQYGDRVPLPRFVEFPGILSFASPATTANPDEERESLCHYHFLSQIAHRIILTRLRDSIFASPKGSWPPGDDMTATSSRSEYPPLALEAEMLHQLEQWRRQLPERLQWDDGDLVPAPSSPENILVVPWLRSRYLIARYHLRRPLLHRALHHPDSMTNDDFEKCNDAISSIIKWTSITRVTLVMGSCLPLKFFICSQLFGLALILHACQHSSIPELRRLVPEEYEPWCRFSLHFLEECAPGSPIIAREYEICVALLKGK